MSGTDSTSPGDARAADIGALLAPWTTAMGADETGYTHHVLRVLELCDLVAPPGVPRPSDRTEFRVAAVFHDLGIWSAGTFDYLPPSIELAAQHLRDTDAAELIPTVTAMIEHHHKLRRAGAADDPVEIFRRADAVDVELALLGRFGVRRRGYRALTRRYPDAGFHRRLVTLAGQRLRTHPTSPLPMLEW
ncbi:HD domain-containing protein [Nocardia sp. NPDC057227]|uniref:HD domain-containing protein n=1 Tax=Nocardia sp. NPDC057227 TaxID=3346056 RepID=UPI00363D2187